MTHHPSHTVAGHRVAHRPVPRGRPRRPDRLGEIADTLSRSTLESILRSLDDVGEVVESVLSAVEDRGARAPRRRPRGRDHRHDCDHDHDRVHDCGHDHHDHHDHHDRDGHDDHDGHHGHECGHHDCAPAPCTCVCCVADADLVINSRVGERRVVPIRVDNTRVREREVSLELGPWSRHGGGQASFLSGAGVSPSKFTVEGCSHARAVLVVETSGLVEEDDNRREIDVDECTTYYADLRITGCDARPVRIALVLLPRDCDPYEIACSCSCC